MKPPVLFDPVHFRCPFCSARCVSGIAPWLDNVHPQVVHEMPVCDRALELGPALVLKQRDQTAN